MSQKPRTFKNPILPGFFPDPSICRVGNDFYLVASSFEYFPGIPIHHSRDLVHWRQIGNALTRSSQLALANAPSSRGIFAPTIRHHRGRFYIVCTNVEYGGNFIVTATDPARRWSDPIWIDKIGFDPSLHFEGDTAYFTRAGDGPSPRHPAICQERIDVKTGRLRRFANAIFPGTGGEWSEAPHLYHIGDWFYLVIAEGGTFYDHSVVVARSRKPMGPFEPCPHNPVLTHRDRKRDAFQALGHADLVDTPNGQHFAVLLGTRPKHGRYHHLGRETFLVPVSWSKDGWPEFGANGRVPETLPAPRLERHPFPRLPARDNFDAPQLRPEYLFVRNPDAKSYSLKARPGSLRLRGLAGSLTDRLPKAFVGRRQTDFDCRCRALLDFEPGAMSDEAGLVVRNSEHFHYALVVRRASLTNPREREAQLWSVIAGKRRLVGRIPLQRGAIQLEIRGTDSSYAFRAGSPRRLTLLGSLSAQKLSSEVATQTGPVMCFTGIVLGMYASGQGQPASCPADFDWFEYKGY